jgi:hypothetical protein
MKIECKVSIEFEDVKTANAILKSIEIDNLNFIKSQIIGRKIETNIEGNTVSSLIHTLDDFLSCVSVADKVTKNK